MPTTVLKHVAKREQVVKLVGLHIYYFRHKELNICSYYKVRRAANALFCLLYVHKLSQMLRTSPGSSVGSDGVLNPGVMSSNPSVILLSSMG